jgi:DNA-binding Xre family transcriptional regulator
MPSTGGTIYAIGADGASSVKIGKTAGVVTRRLAALQIGHPMPLQVLASVSVEQDLGRIEQAVHRFLDAERQRGEWFAIAIDQAQLEALILRATQWLKKESPSPGASLGEKVARLRCQHGLTQAELARRAGISQAIISRLEGSARHTVMADVLKRLAQTLGCTTDYLVGMHEDDESEECPAGVAMAGT